MVNEGEIEEDGPVATSDNAGGLSALNYELESNVSMSQYSGDSDERRQKMRNDQIKHISKVFYGSATPAS